MTLSLTTPRRSFRELKKHASQLTGVDAKYGSVNKEDYFKYTIRYLTKNVASGLP